MKRSTPTLVLCAAVLAAVAACTPTGSDEPASPESATSTPAAEGDPSEATPSESAEADDQDGDAEESEEGSDASDADDDSSSAEDSASGSRPESSSVTVDLGGDTTVVEPTDVYCSGEPGDIEHIIGKTDNQLPLIEVSGSHFAMVKLDQRGAPEKTENPQDISFGEDWVTFTDATVGSATLDGSMVCTAWED